MGRRMSRMGVTPGKPADTRAFIEKFRAQMGSGRCRRSSSRRCASAWWRYRANCPERRVLRQRLALARPIARRPAAKRNDPDFSSAT